MIANKSSMADDKTFLGSCLCRAVQFKICGAMRPVIACHCRQCRKSSGHYLAGTAVRSENLIILEDRGLRWFQSSPTAKRGFCYLCGSSLLWCPSSAERIVIFAGALDGDTGLQLTTHIFAADKGDYYEITENADILVLPASGKSRGNLDPCQL